MNPEKDEETPTSNVFTRTLGTMGTAGKIGLATAVGFGIGYQSLKRTLIGDPPSKWRKALVYGAVAGTIFYSSCGDQVDAVGNSVKNHMESRLEVSRDEALQGLQAEIAEYKDIVNQNELQRRKARLQAKEQRSQYQASMDSLEHLLDAYQDSVVFQRQRTEIATKEIQTLQRVVQNQANKNRAKTKRRRPVERKKDTEQCWYKAKFRENANAVAKLVDDDWVYQELDGRIPPGINQRNLPEGLPVLSDTCPEQLTGGSWFAGHPPNYVVVDISDQTALTQIRKKEIYSENDVTRIRLYNDEFNNSLRQHFEDDEDPFQRSRLRSFFGDKPELQAVYIPDDI